MKTYLPSKAPEMASAMAAKRKEQALAGLQGTHLTGYTV